MYVRRLLFFDKQEQRYDLSGNCDYLIGVADYKWGNSDL
jgi:hypothetical protein